TDIEPDSKIHVPVYFNTSSLVSGPYTANAVVRFQNSEEQFSDSFLVGELRLNVLNYTRSLEPGKINRFFVTVQSEWNDPIDNVYADITLADSQGNETATVRSPSISLAGRATGDIVAFIDTSELPEGTYHFRGVLHYNDKSQAFDGELTIGAASVGPSLETPSQFNPLLVVGAIVAGLLLVVLVFNIFLFTKFLKGKNEKK
ncbi:hypothetical protein J4475_01915, partial [Candidatus Woesearchaeota archaeon]|nr:hypothetical protein [Candidatus Woesearchaeota archaeon]